MPNFSNLPGYMGGNQVGTQPGKEACRPGDTLAHGSVCTVGCLPGFDVVVATPAQKTLKGYVYDLPNQLPNEFSCKAGTLIPPNLQCQPSTCKYANKAWPGWTGCFDTTYPCEACCTTGFNLQGKPCFPPGGQYSQSKCCLNSVPIASPATSASCASGASTSVALPAGAPQCANPFNPSSPQCFDATYTCTCCQTGFTAGGLPCWDKFYRREDCCANAALQKTTGTSTFCSCSAVGGVQLRNPENGLCYAYTSDEAATRFQSCDKTKAEQCFIPSANSAFYAYMSPMQCADGTSVAADSAAPRLWSRSCSGVTKVFQVYSSATLKIGNAPVQVVGGGNVSPFSVSQCAKDPLCFDVEYTCDSCCQTGRSSTQGLACWVAPYNAAACCNSPTPGAGSTAAALFSAVAPGTKVDSRGNPATVDSRGFSAGSAGFDSRGRPIDFGDSASSGVDARASNVAAIASSVAGCAVLLAGIIAATVYRRRKSSKHSSSESDSERRHSPRVLPVHKGGQYQLSAELSTKAASLDSSEAEASRAAWPSP